jgi:hypothetical protein
VSLIFNVATALFVEACGSGGNESAVVISPATSVLHAIVASKNELKQKRLQKFNKNIVVRLSV